MARRMPIAKPAFAPPDIPPDEDFSATAAAVGELVDADCALNGDATEVVSSVGDEDDDDFTWWVGTSVSLNVVEVDSAASLETDFDEEIEEIEEVGEVEEETASGVTTWEVGLEDVVGCCVVLGCCVGVDWVCCVVWATATGVVEVLGCSSFA